MVYGYIVLRKKNGNDGPQFPVHKSVKIGRGTHCDVRIHVQSVSEQHCFILVEKRKRAVIQNLSSSSQTLVNGIPVGKSGNTLKHQDFITVGERSFRWLYSESSPFFQGKKGSAQKRRKSEADSAQGSQNIAVVNPLFHKRRTVGAAFTYSESSCTPKTAADPHFEKAKKSTGGKKVIASTPIPSSAPSGKYSSRHVVTKSKILQGQTPETLKSALKSPAVSSNVVGGSLFEVTSRSHSPVRESSVLKTPVPKTLTSLSATPASISSPVKTLVRKLSTSKTSGDTKAAPITRPIRKSLPSLTATSHISQTLARKSLPRKSVSRKTSSQTPAKTSNVKMPGNPSPKLKSKSSKTPGSGRKSKAQKRRLSSPPPPASKRLKIESPKSIDKKKMAVLMGIHGKSRKMAGSSALSNVKFVLSTRKTPIVKALKTPHSSTSKKNCAQQLSTSKTKSSSKKPRRLLYSEMLKKKAVQKANAVARKLAPVQKASTRAVNRKLVVPKMFEESPGTFKFGSTGHVDSPETIFVGRRVAERLFVTNQGQKVPMALKRHQESVNLSGIAESYDTCSKIITKSPGRPNVILKSSPFRSKSTPPGSPAATKSSFRPCSPPLICQVSSVAENHSIKNQKTLSTVKRNSNGKKVTPVKPSTPARKGSVSSPSSTKASGNTQTKMSRASGSVSQKKPSKTPPFRKTLSSSGSRRQRSLLTSTPAVRRNKDSLADSLFESPSSLLAAQISAPQSPASGRKSRMDMVALSTSHVYSPQASPGKSSLKSSPSKSPPSDGPSKNLSVSFSDSIRIKMLVPGSKRSLNTTAPLRSPASILGEDDSAATPDQTTFDFSSVKTPNVPKEMFVSSILSSGASSSGLASGSAKRKAKVVRTPQDELGNLHGVRRLMKTPASPPGYVDVKGVKRLMSNVCKTPTYLAVEGVKKLFGDATVAASNGLSNFAGVRELFASPSPKPNRKKPLNAIPRSTSRKSSPVAKIQAEVESKGRSSSDSPSRATRGSFSLNASSEKQSSRTGSSPARVSVTYSPKLVVDTLESTPFNFSGRVTRKASKLIVVSQSESSKGASQEQVLKEKLTSAGQGRMSVGGTPKKSNKKEVKSQPRRNKSIDTSPIVQSSPKRRTRKAVKDVSGDAISPLLEPKTMRTRRGAKQTILKPETSPLTKNGSKKSAKDTEIVSKIAVQESSPSLKSMGKARSSRRAPLKPSPPSESVMTKCTTRKGAKTSQTSVKSSKTKLNKLELSPSNVGILTPIKKTRRDLTLSASPVDSLPKRVTRRTGKEVLSTQKASTEHKNNLQKRKLSSDTTPSKKAKTTSKNDNLSSSSDKDEKKNTRRKRGESQKNEVHLKGVSPRQKAETLSPRRTRSRK